MIGIEVEGDDAMRARIAAIQERVQNMEPALEAIGDVVLAESRRHIDEGGPGWRTNVTGNPLLKRSGALYDSLTRGGTGNVFEVSPTGVMVGTSLKVGDGYVLGQLMHGGTGVYGPFGQRITPKNGDVLAFMLGGKRVFARSVAGSPKREFLYIDQQIAQEAVSIIRQFVITGVARGNNH